MFDFFKLLSFGEKIQAHGETWPLIESIKDGYCLAIRDGFPLPAQVFIVKQDGIKEDDKATS